MSEEREVGKVDSGPTDHLTVQLASLQKRVNLLPSLYQTLTREAAVELFAQKVWKTQNPDDLKRVEYLRWYLRITTHIYRKESRRMQQAVIDHLNKEHPELFGICNLRQKGMVPFDTKTIRKQEKAKELGQESSQTKCPLDVHAMRIILDGNNMAETYIAAECIMDYFTQKGFKIDDSLSTVKSGTFIPEKYPTAVIPTAEERASLEKKYLGKYKDYNVDPKANSYQALHFVVWIEFYADGELVKFPLEVQIYTKVAFDRVNEQDSTEEVKEDTRLENHDAYKHRTEGYLYAWRGEVSILDLAINGFEGIEYDFDTGEYKDIIGLVNPLIYSLST